MADVPHVEAVQDPFNPSTGDSSPPKNWATSESVRTRVRNEILPLVNEVRDRKRRLNDRWASLNKVWSLEHEYQGYEGRSNIYVPAGKKGAETLTSQLVAATFPGEDVFSIEAKAEEFAAGVEDTKLLLQHRVQSTAKVRSKADRFYRQLVVTGNSPVKYYYKRKTVKGMRRAKRQPDYSGIPSPVEQEYVLYEGPVFETLDPANLYVWPEDVGDLIDAEMVFEDITTTVAALRAKAAEGIYISSEVDAICRSLQDEKNLNSRRKLEGQGIMSPHDTANGPYGLADITEVYIHFDPEAENRFAEESPIPCLITLDAGGRVLRVIENPFWHKMPPYSIGRMGQLVGRFWGTGFVEAIRELNLLLNDQTNQAMDCATYALNPVVLANEDMLLGALPDLEPGVQWLVRDINAAVKFDRPPGDLIQYGSILTSQTMSWLNDFIGAPPVLSGGSAPGRAFRTATGVGAAQSNAMKPLQEIVRLCETDVWEPTLMFFHSLDQQFASDQVLARFGPNIKRLDPRLLGGDYVYRWMASTQTANQQVKGSQVVQLLGLLAQPGLGQLLQARGIKLNPVPLLKRLYEEVFGFRDFNKVVEENLLGSAGMQAQPARTADVNSSELMENPLAGENEMLDENPEFAATRMGANSIAGLFGALGEGGVPGDASLTEDGGL